MSNINISEHSKLSYQPEHKLIKVSNGIQLDNVQRMREPGTFIPNWMSHSNPSPQGSGNPREEEAERFSDPGGQRTPRKQGFLNTAGLTHA